MKQTFTWPIVYYLRFLARIALFLNHPTIIGIAGSVGKSSARNTLFAILRDHYPTKMLHGNSETGIPLGLLGIEPHGYTVKDWITMLLRAPLGIFYLKKTKYLIVEMGIDDPYPPKNMEYLLTILNPHIAISLNISATHTMQFEKLFHGRDVKNKKEFLLQKIAEEDTKIITQSDAQVGIYNVDDTYITKALHKTQLNTKLLTFGHSGENNISYKGYSATLDGTHFEFEIEDSHHINIFLKSFILPQEYQQTIGACILAALQTGLSPKHIKESLEKNFTLPKGRATIFEGINKTIIIDSSYNASKSAVLAFLRLLKNLKEDTKRPIVFLFGDMRELGNEARSEHEEVTYATIGTVDYFYCVGPLTREFVLPIADNYGSKLKELRWFKNAHYAGEYLLQNIPKNAIVLVKGSQNEIFLEEALKKILKNKGDEKKLCRQEEFWMSKKITL